MSDVPEPEFWALEAEPVPHAAAPTLAFTLRARERSQREVYAIALTTQIFISAADRAYDESARELLVDLFGEPERWGDTARAVLWAREQALVPGFTGSTTFSVHVPCSNDLDVATVKYFHSLSDGVVPLSFQFSGTVFYCGERDRLQLTQISWSSEAQFQLPVETWRRTVEEHHPNGGFVRLGSDAHAGLRRFQTERGLPSIDACVSELLEAAKLEVR